MSTSSLRRSRRPSPGLDKTFRTIWWFTSKLDVSGSGDPPTSFWKVSSFQWE